MYIPVRAQIHIYQVLVLHCKYITWVNRSCYGNDIDGYEIPLHYSIPYHSTVHWHHNITAQLKEIPLDGTCCIFTSLLSYLQKFICTF